MRGPSVRLATPAVGTVAAPWAREQADGGGQHVRNSKGASSVPPTTTMASGRWTWLPIAVEKAAGNRPTQAAAQVISTGRIRTVQVSIRASRAAAGIDQAVGAAQDHDAVHGGDAEQGDEADGGRDAERLPARNSASTPPMSAMAMALPASMCRARAEAGVQQQQDQADRDGTAIASRCRAFLRSPNSPTHSTR